LESGSVITRLLQQLATCGFLQRLRSFVSRETRHQLNRATAQCGAELLHENEFIAVCYCDHGDDSGAAQPLGIFIAIFFQETYEASLTEYIHGSAHPFTRENEFKGIGGSIASAGPVRKRIAIHRVFDAFAGKGLQYRAQFSPVFPPIRLARSCPNEDSWQNNSYLRCMVLTSTTARSRC
jgi:hypothetical protein